MAHGGHGVTDSRASPATIGPTDKRLGECRHVGGKAGRPRDTWDSRELPPSRPPERFTPGPDAQDTSIRQDAERTGKSVDHVEAVLDGYVNTTKRPTEPDTVDEIVIAVGLRLSFSGLPPEQPGEDGP
jgi:hypothetical protein